MTKFEQEAILKAKKKLLKKIPNENSPHYEEYKKVRLTRLILTSCSVVVSLIIFLLILFAPMHTYKVKPFIYSAGDEYYPEGLNLTYEYSLNDVVSYLVGNITRDESDNTPPYLNEDGKISTSEVLARVKSLKNEKLSEFERANNMMFYVDELSDVVRHNWDELVRKGLVVDTSENELKFYEDCTQEYFNVLSNFKTEFEYVNYTGLSLFLENFFESMVGENIFEDPTSPLYLLSEEIFNTLVDSYLVGEYEFTEENYNMIMEISTYNQFEVNLNSDSDPILPAEMIRYSRENGKYYLDYAANSFSTTIIAEVILNILITALMGIMFVFGLIIFASTLIKQKGMPGCDAVYAFSVVGVFLNVVLTLTVFVVDKFVTYAQILPTVSSWSIVAIVLCVVAIVLNNISNKQIEKLEEMNL